MTTNNLFPPITVLKLGSSVLRSDADLPHAVHEVYRRVRDGQRVVVVVSAFGNTTDELIERGRRIADGEPNAHSEALAALLATGEASTAALLTMALGRAGIAATPFDCRRAQLRTSGALLDATPHTVDRSALLSALEERPVVVLPGFVGVHTDSALSLLGRGGSDLTALFVAQQLGAERCVLLKDVDGIYDRDPNSPRAARRYELLSFEDALALNAPVVQSKAIRFAARRDIAFEVRALDCDHGTTISAQRTRFATARTGGKAVRVALLGLGTVGLGVFRRLANDPRFSITGVAVRDRTKHLEDGVDPQLLSEDAWSVTSAPCDVVIELIGGGEPAGALIAAALASGKHVVTANKAVIAARGEELEAIAQQSGVRLSFSAAVGGSVPVLERLSALAPIGIDAIEGVVNGTTNFVLDRVANGRRYEDAVADAQAAGYAEADPSLDLDGTDAAQKLSIATRVAFGSGVDPASIAKCGVQASDTPAVQRAHELGQCVRLVASARRANEGLAAQVALRSLPAKHPLAALKNADNCVVVTLSNGHSEVLTGVGAGRWPTTEAVFADLDALARRRATHPRHAAPVLSLVNGEQTVPEVAV